MTLSNPNKRVVATIAAVIATTLFAIAGGDEGNESKSFTVSKGGTVEVSVNIGAVHVKTWDKNEVTIQIIGGEEEDDRSGFRIRQRENTILVETDRRFGHEIWGDVDINVSMPSQFNVQLQTSAGDIDITGKVVGSVEAQTSGGNIIIGSVDGKTDLVTSGGDVITEDIKGDLYLTTSGGNIRVGAVTGITDVHTSGGDIEIERADQKLTAETAGGNLHIGDIGGDALVETSGGDIILEHIAGNARLKTAGGNIELKSANGHVIARTAGGDIRGDSIAGSLDARTSAGNIDVVLFPSGSGKSKLVTSVGDIRFYIPENAKASISARNRVHDWGAWGSEDEDAITSDFKETTYDRDGRGREVRASYTLNGGGQQISLETSMGKIQIMKPGSRDYDGRGSKRKWKAKGRK